MKAITMPYPLHAEITSPSATDPPGCVLLGTLACTRGGRVANVRALTDVSISSDASFPFRDSIDHASGLGVKYPHAAPRPDKAKRAIREDAAPLCLPPLRTDIC